MGDEKNPEKDFEKEKKKKIEKEPEKQTKKAPKPKKRKKKGKAGFLFILLILLAVICAGVYLLIPSKNRVSHNQYFGLEDDNQYGLIVNSEIVDITNGAPFEENGVWYLPFSTLYYEISDAFYYDGLALLYTDPLQTYSAAPGESFYTDSDGIKYTLTYQPCYFKDGSLCIALDYLKLMDYSYYTVDDTMKSIWVFNDWSEQSRASLLKDTKARTQAGIKNDIVASLATGDVVTVLEQGASWSQVQTQTGLIGYVQNKMLGEITEEAKAVPDGRPLPKYTNIAMDEMVVMGWHQVFSESGYSQLDDIISTAKGMNVICPTWFTIKDNDGNIQNLGEKKYVTKAHKAGLQVWVMLDDINISTDGLQVFGTTSHRKTLITAVIDAVKELGADGINLDVETIKSDVGPSYIQFIRELSAACRKEKLVLSVDNYSPMPHTAFYDRTQQGQVVDYVVVMAYDEHYVKGPEAGSTSSLAFVKQSAERTIAEVPKEKVIVGLPFYSRLWCETPAESESDKNDNSQVFVDNSDGTYDSKNNKYLLSSKGVSMEGENNIIREHDLSLTWLDDVGQFYTEYEENGSWYRLWVEDENSMDLKMQAACSYEPGGVAFFKLNMENKETWSIIRKYTDK